MAATLFAPDIMDLDLDLDLEDGEQVWLNELCSTAGLEDERHFGSEKFTSKLDVIATAAPDPDDRSVETLFVKFSWKTLLFFLAIFGLLFAPFGNWVFRKLKSRCFGIIVYRFKVKSRFFENRFDGKMYGSYDPKFCAYLSIWLCGRRTWFTELCDTFDLIFMILRECIYFAPNMLWKAVASLLKPQGRRQHQAQRLATQWEQGTVDEQPQGMQQPMQEGPLLQPATGAAQQRQPLPHQQGQSQLQVQNAPGTTMPARQEQEQTVLREDQIAAAAGAPEQHDTHGYRTTSTLPLAVLPVTEEEVENQPGDGSLDYSESFDAGAKDEDATSIGSPLAGINIV